MSIFNLSEKVIVVTGAASGIGAETAAQLKSAGATVIGLDRNQPDKNVDQYIEIDLADPASIACALDQIPTGIDGLCNIAGLPPTAPAPLVMKVNILGLQALTNGLIDKMNQDASIVNVASLAGAGWPDAVQQIKAFQAEGTFDNIDEICAKLDIEGARSYFFSKEVLIAWTMQNRWTWRDRGIRMNCVSPGPVDTPILKDFLETLGERAEEDSKVMDRAGVPVDIAPVVVFLCTKGSTWLRGINVACDGGMFSHVNVEKFQL
jgi:NAD(P)-dependent dehydrogenase (short-subunit alcohol dehydrogenase family)